MKVSIMTCLPGSPVGQLMYEVHRAQLDRQTLGVTRSQLCVTTHSFLCSHNLCCLKGG